MLKKNYQYILIAGIALLAILALIINVFSKEQEPIIVPLTQEAPIHKDINTSYIYVDIKGAISRPGVYKVDINTRVFQLIQFAGGVTNEADISKLNLSQTLSDQTMIIIPKFGDEVYSTTYNHQEPSKISISTASKETLVTLPNIGPATADKIISYRIEHGAFSTIEQIMNVSGIGQATYDAIAPFIIP